MDLSQFASDISGGSSLIDAMMGSVLQRMVISSAERLFNNSNEISNSELDNFLIESQMVLRQWPNLSNVLKNEALSNVFSIIRWDATEKCWKNIDIGILRGLGRSQPDLSSCLSWEKQRLFFSVYAHSSTMAEAYCKPEDLDQSCLRIAKLVFDEQCSYAEKHGKKRSIPYRIYNRISERLGSQPKTAPLELAVASQCGISAAIMKQMEKFSMVKFTYAATRVLALYRLEYQRSGQCPTGDFFERFDLRESLIDPVSNKPMKINRLGPGHFVVRPGVSIGPKPSPENQPAVFIRCPSAKRQRGDEVTGAR